MQNGLNMDASYDFQDCTGLKVKPRKGDGLLFYSLFPNGTIDPVSNIIIIITITLQPTFLMRKTFLNLLNVFHYKGLSSTVLDIHNWVDCTCCLLASSYSHY